MGSIEHGYSVITNNATEGTVYLYGQIGDDLFGDGVSAKQFADDINALDVAVLNVQINSPGGSVFDGIAMKASLDRHPARIRVSIDGVAASIASVVAMAGDEITIADGGFVMVHRPFMMTAGTASDLRGHADLLDKIDGQIQAAYHHRTGLPLADIDAMMEAETWMDSAEAVERGFADGLSPELRIAAKFDMTRYQNTPAGLDVAPVLIDNMGEIDAAIGRVHRERTR